MREPENALGLYPGLSPMEGKFVFEYMREDLKGREYMNAKEAAIRAGYAPSSANAMANQLMARPQIVAQLGVLAGQKLRRADIQASDVMGKLRDLIMFDPADLFSTDGHLLAIHDMPEHARYAITGIEVKEDRDSTGKPTGTYTHKIRFSKPIEALGLAARIVKLVDNGNNLPSDTTSLRQLVEASFDLGKKAAKQIEHEAAEASATDAVEAPPEP